KKLIQCQCVGTLFFFFSFPHPSFLCHFENRLKKKVNVDKERFIDLQNMLQRRHDDPQKRRNVKRDDTVFLLHPSKHTQHVIQHQHKPTKTKKSAKKSSKKPSLKRKKPDDDSDDDSTKKKKQKSSAPNAGFFLSFFLLLNLFLFIRSLNQK